jgi:glycine/D-amino acid oxidase-like deaminating enzyme
MEIADAVVIGGGHHGFVAAAVLADAGSAALELIYRDSASAR